MTLCAGWMAGWLTLTLPVAGWLVLTLLGAGWLVLALLDAGCMALTLVGAGCLAGDPVLTRGVGWLASWVVLGTHWVAAWLELALPGALSGLKEAEDWRTWSWDCSRLSSQKAYISLLIRGLACGIEWDRVAD